MQILPIALGAAIFIASAIQADELTNIQLGPRPFYLIDKMPDGQLKTKLQSCANGPFSRTNFSIGHRGAPLQFPEHTRESYQAAARMGAGIIECDVTFTADLALICRHSQGDLATSTNILATPLATACIAPFTPATFNVDGSIDEPASATCRTSELTLAEFLSLKGKMDAGNRAATTPEAFMNGTTPWRTDLYATGGTLMTHAQSIALLQSLGVEFIPELKAPIVDMAFTSPVTGEVFTQTDFAQKMIDEYTAAGIPAQDVHPQSFSPDDVLYWLKNAPEFGENAILLDSRKYDASNPSDIQAPTLQQIADMGITTVAPPQWVLLKEDDGQITPSDYALAAQAANLDIITWTLERSGRLREDVLDGRSKYYYQSTLGALTADGDIYTTLDVLTQQVGIKGIFSDWPATVASRNVDPLKTVVVSICGMRSDSDTFNVIPDQVTLRGTARYLDPSVQELIISRLTLLAENTAKAFGVEAEVIYTPCVPPTINSPDAAQRAADVAQAVSGDVIRDQDPVMPGEDFADMLAERPGAFLFIGNGNRADLHNPAYEFNDDAIPAGCSWFAEMAERRMPLA